MKSSNIFSLLAVVIVSAVEGTTFSPSTEFTALVDNASENLRGIFESRVGTASNCTSENVVVRKTWSALSDAEKTEYIAAVQCLTGKAPITPLDVVPGVRSRFDDFVATHVNQTTNIHWTSNFYTFHRYFTWAYEEALRNDCGYTGTQPYWDFSLTDATAENPLFDGSSTSLGGDGTFIPGYEAHIIIPFPEPLDITPPPGTGGGCITTGPFVNHSVNLGPHGAPIADGYQYNPRCVERNFRDFILQAALSYDNITTVLQTPDLQTFSDLMNSGNGLHANGHTALGGMQDDLWASASDPAFYFHHAAIDRIWALWQAQDQNVRIQEVSDTMTIKDLPPSARGTLDTKVDIGYNGGPKTIGDLSSTIDGMFCYIYE